MKNKVLIAQFFVDKDNKWIAEINQGMYQDEKVFDGTIGHFQEWILKTVENKKELMEKNKFKK